MFPFIALMTIAASALDCNLQEHMRYEFTPCNQETQTANAFFFYHSELHCDLRKGKSEPLPIFMQEVSCENLCGGSGLYTTFDLGPENIPKMVCG